jgi:hypothetical protein
VKREREKKCVRNNKGKNPDIPDNPDSSRPAVGRETTGIVVR